MGKKLILLLECVQKQPSFYVSYCTITPDSPLFIAYIILTENHFTILKCLCLKLLETSSIEETRKPSFRERICPLVSLN